MTDGGTDRTLARPADLEGLRFDERGLLPVVAQDATDGRVLMVAWADREALERTLETGRMHYRSRSRSTLWEKGATSGNTQTVVSLHADCDGDTVLALVEPAGPACHTGEATCFGPGSGVPARAAGRDPLDALWSVLAERRRSAAPAETSYTARLLGDENLRLKKLGEEATELALALATGKRERAVEEAADLLYHVLVGLLAAGASLDDVRAELAARAR
ncbi:MAG: bifunctional phosphoribosyl-AMP cyclohydrolase/phosphoribosyl-ATP diphosphatase HisIE [Gemmatimonadetes bacterium]|nr:MAG: bifunctional phosphoribosyl-AMP cyclohydrolase/phosphoribosyl-ATP diphosphatase HisIE [Gemmatimonadota bacterium]